MIEANQVDHKILAVAAKDPRFDQIHEIGQVFPHVLREMEHFFEIYKRTGVSGHANGRLARR